MMATEMNVSRKGAKAQRKQADLKPRRHDDHNVKTEQRNSDSPSVVFFVPLWLIDIPLRLCVR
jgi:hypothetical protein